MPNEYLWPFSVNWSEPFRIKYQTVTEIIESRARKEQRISHRQVPRKTFSFTCTVHADSRRRFEALLTLWQAKPFVVAEAPRVVYLPEVTSGTTIEVEAVMPWMVVDRYLVIYDRTAERWDYTIITGIAGTTLTVFPGIGASYPVGSRLFAASIGRLEDVRANRKSDDASLVDVEFSCAPSQAAETAQTADVEHNGREVLTLKPNWNESVEATYEYDSDRIDYKHGRRLFYYPAGYSKRIHKATYLRRGADEAEWLRAFFWRVRGRQDEFYMPTRSNDLPLLSKTASTLTVDGTDVYEFYATDTVYKNICVEFEDGTEIYREVTGIISSGGNSVLSISPDWTFDTSTVKRISWMPVWRLASDDLTVEWVTESAATAQFALTTLEDLEGD
jgi:hypothetical protein